MRKCLRCNESLRLGARGRVPSYCSARCRVAAHRAGRIPAELVAAARWVRHDRKRPVTVSGAAASSTDASTWSTHRAAVASKVGDGLGFVLGDGFACLDLDHCLIDGKPLLWAQQVLDQAPAAYVEVSPGGDGLHVWGKAAAGPGTRRAGLECYSTGRYITVTGKVFRPGGLPDLSSFFTVFR